MKVILGSKSPRRQELLRMIVPHFSVETADVDEHIEPDADPREAVIQLAERKAAAFLPEGDELIITADTVVAHEGAILGKPATEKDACAMLSDLSGSTHSVLTGFCLKTTKETIVDCEETRVTFGTIADEELLAYVESGEPMDKAGAYGIQGLGGLFVERIEGDYYNVMGLPVCRLYHLIRDRFPAVELTLLKQKK